MTSRRESARMHAKPLARRRPRRPANDYYPDEPGWTERPARARRRGNGRRKLFVVLLLFVIAASAGLLLVWLRVAAFNEAVSTAPAASSALFGPLNGRDRVNVLIVGYGGEQHSGGTLSDSIIVLSIDPTTDTSTLVPIPRDLWIEGLPEMPNGKINEAFARGWSEGGVEAAGERAAAVVSKVTGLEVRHWMAMDFAGFREMVDAVGGVTVENPTAFSYTWSPYEFDAGVFNAGSFEAGTLHLDGEQALAYTRVRYASVRQEASDFARSVRQQRVLGALRRELGSGGIGAIGPGLRLMDALEGRMTTSLSAIDLFLLSGHLNTDRRLELTEDVALVATRSSTGQYILLPIGWTGVGGDYGSLHRFIADGLADPGPPGDSPAG